MAFLCCTCIYISTANKLFTQQKRRGVPGISRYHMKIDTRLSLSFYIFVRAREEPGNEATLIPKCFYILHIYSGTPLWQDLLLRVQIIEVSVSRKLPVGVAMHTCAVECYEGAF